MSLFRLLINAEFHKLTTVFQLSFFILAVLLSAPSFSLEGEKAELSIEQQPLSAAMKQLMVQMDIHLLVESTLIKGLSTPGVKGLFTVEEALELLLNGTELRFKRINRNMYVISKNVVSTATSESLTVSDTEEATNNDRPLQEIVIVGETHHNIGLQEPSTATKVFIPTMEVPRSLEGITAELFIDRANATLAEAFRDYSSINIADESGLIYLRGFRIYDQSILRGGLPSISRGITSTSLQNIEGIEVAKGANSSLYGYGQPGGVINLMPKTPKSLPFTNLVISYGNYDRYFSVDTNNPLDLHENVTQRFNFMLRKENKHNQGSGDVKQVQVAPAISYKMDGGKKLSLNMEYNHQEIEGLGGMQVFDNPVPEFEPIFDFLFPNLVEVPFYPNSGSEQEDLKKSDSIDIWVKFKAPLNNQWDYNIALYGGKSEITQRALRTPMTLFSVFHNEKNVDKIRLIYNNLSFGDDDPTIQIKEEFENYFLDLYGNQVTGDRDIVESIYGDSTTPGWSDDEIRLYQRFGESEQLASQLGFDINAHGVVNIFGASHDLIVGTSYAQHQFDYEGIAFYSGELFDKGSEFIDNGDLVTGIGLQRFSQFVWFYPYGPVTNNVDVILPDQLAAQANLPIDARYQFDRSRVYYKAKVDTKSLGFYIQDHISLSEQWRVLLSGGLYRYQRDFYNDSSNFLGQFMLNQYPSLTTLDQSYRDYNFSPQLGLVYLPIEDLSFYASYGRQFDIVNGFQTNGKAAEPEVTKAREIGAKWWPLPDFNISSSVFRISKENYAFKGSLNDGFGNIRQSGLIESNGAEVNMTGYMTPQVKLATNYSHSKLSLESGSNELDVLSLGLINGVPKRSGGLWLQYLSEPYGKQGWTVGAGLNYVGKRTYFIQAIVAELKSYMLVDFGASYKNDDFRVSLNIDNIQNKKWFAGASTKVNPLPEFAKAVNEGTPYNASLGYGTRVRFTTELFF